ncbi:MAG: zinc-ribbon domain-containing protein [Campylobacterales bacterium]|nr:zinc-ribbon domain-containing protein [Campylobacterales bacterium]
MTFCSKCGCELLQKSKFCPSCGENLSIFKNVINEKHKLKNQSINTNQSINPTDKSPHSFRKPEHNSFSLSPVNTKSFSKPKKILITCLGLVILITGYTTLKAISNSSPTTPSEKVLTNDESNAIRFKNLIPQLDRNADIHKDISEPELTTLIAFVNMNGYKCDTVSFAMPFPSKHQYSLTCNNYRYSYEIEDIGGNPVIVVK